MLARRALFALALVARSHAYLRSASPCKGSQVIASESECQTAALAIGIYTTLGTNPDSQWPQGCYFHGTSAYWQPVAQTGTQAPVPTDGGNEYLCRSGYQTSTSCSAGTSITTFSDCTEASLVVGKWWKWYHLTSQCATGSTAVASSAECSSSDVIGDVTTFFYESNIDSRWKQGCFIHGTKVYSQLQRSTANGNPLPKPTGGAFICRTLISTGDEWPQGCFVHDDRVLFNAHPQTGSSSGIFKSANGGMICSTGYGSGATGSPPTPLNPSQKSPPVPSISVTGRQLQSQGPPLSPPTPSPPPPSPSPPPPSPPPSPPPPSPSPPPPSPPPYLESLVYGDNSGCRYCPNPPFSDACVGDEVLIGVDVRSGGRIDAISGLCASLQIVRQAPRFIITPVVSSSLPFRGGPGGVLSSWRCPAGQVVTGIRAGVDWYSLGNVGVTCHPVDVSGSPGNFTIIRGNAPTLSPMYGT